MNDRCGYMSSESRDPNQEAEYDVAEEAEHNSQTEDTEASPGLTIELPDGSTSVADAIITNREMLSNPQEYEIATEEDITHLSEAMESLSAKIEKTDRQYEESQSRVTELEDLVERQQRQINELQSMITSLTEILGTEVEWTTFGEE